MELLLKRPDRIVPEYSLTGDLLSYQRCALQYRYYNGSALPPSRPVQMWYGEFIHGMFEAAFGLWEADAAAVPFPWPCTPISDTGPPEPPPPGLPANDLRVVGWPIEEALVQQGKRARSRRARLAAYRRAVAAINIIGPHLFPLIADAEQKVIGTRLLPPNPGGPPLRSERYALHGIIDVLTNVQLADVGSGNIIRDAVEQACPGLSGTFEVIVDYKGSHRPRISDPNWNLGRWQVQTYAWLRQKQQLSHPVAAGILIYVNELAPNTGDIRRLQLEIQNGTTDVAPARGDPDFYALRAWTPGTVPQFSDRFRFRRAIRVIPIDQASMEEATSAFDNIVRNIEESVSHEAVNGSIMNTWQPNCQEEATCAACDFRYFCSSDLARRGGDANPDNDDDGI
jgi:CRISPR/Cas system-associated exonuclease Cas4 (RecB family)